MSESALSDDQISSAIETPTANLPAVRPELEEAWAKIETSGLGDRMKSALRRIAGGDIAASLQHAGDGADQEFDRTVIHGELS